MNGVSHSSVKAKKAHGETAAEVADDFDAIEQAVMATPRGRWFLAEYLRRRQSAELARLMAAMDRLQQAASRSSALPAGEEAAWNGLRLLLAQAADKLAQGLNEVAEPTLPQAAAGRLAHLLGKARMVAEHDAQAAQMLLPRLTDVLSDMLWRLADMLGEPQLRDAPALPPSSAEQEPHQVQPSAPQSQAAGTPPAESRPTAAATTGAMPPDGGPAPARGAAAVAEGGSKARQRRIVIHRHGRSRELDIPLPENAAGKERNSGREEASRRKAQVRIRR